jgi:anaerobic selenocysteine-containing dehydrogenase
VITARACACPLCEAMCGLELTLDGDRIIQVRGDPKDPLSAGFLCPKAIALPQLAADECRLNEPMLRTGDEWRPICWRDALKLAGEKLGDVQRRHGPDAVAFYSGNPNLHSYAAQLVEPPLRKALASRNCYTTASVDHLPHLLVAYEMFGNQLLLPVPDLDRTEFLLVFGANPAESNGSLMGAPGFARRQRQLRERGGRVVVVDPRRTRTAELADVHLPIRPGTDALLLMSLVRTLFALDLVRPGRLAGAIEGIEQLRAASCPFAPDQVSPATGVSAAAIIDLARQFGTARAAVCYGRFGVSTQEFGSTCAWLIHALNLLTGNFDRAGGSMFTRPAVDIVAAATALGEKGGTGRRPSRARRLPGFAGLLPLATLAEEIETPGEGQVRALINSAGNPVLSSPNGGRLDAALASLEFMVSIDRYINETTRHAHLILPAAMPLERDRYEVVFRAFGVRNTARFEKAVVPPPPGVLEDWQIYCRLGGRIARRRAGLSGVLNALVLSGLELVTPRRILALLLRVGPYRLSLSALASESHATDLGALQICMPQRLGTRNKRIRLAPPRLLSDVDRLKTRMQESPAIGQLSLIGRRQLRSNNSWMHHLEHLQRPNNRCALMMSGFDAAERGLRSGQTVEIRSRTGAVRAELEVTDRIMPGVVSLPHGFGHGRLAGKAPMPSAWLGVSMNDLTDDERLDPISGTAAFSGVPVDVATCAGEPTALCFRRPQRQT